MASDRVRELFREKIEGGGGFRFLLGEVYHNKGRGYFFRITPIVRDGYSTRILISIGRDGARPVKIADGPRFSAKVLGSVEPTAEQVAAMRAAILAQSPADTWADHRDKPATASPAASVAV